MTPDDLRAAVDHLRTFLDDIDTCYHAAGLVPQEHRHNRVIIAPGYKLTIGDLHVLLAAVDPAGQPIDRIPTPASLNYLRDRRQQNPRGAER